MYDDAKWKMTWGEEIAQQEQLNSKETQYFCHADAFNDKQWQENRTLNNIWAEQISSRKMLEIFSETPVVL